MSDSTKFRANIIEVRNLPTPDIPEKRYAGAILPLATMFCSIDTASLLPAS